MVLSALSAKWLCGLTVLLMTCFFFTGQSYEIRMLDNRKAGDIPEINGKLVKVSISSLTVLLANLCCLFAYEKE